MASSPIASNFGFLVGYGPALNSLATSAERALHGDPETSMLRLREFAELLARQAAARTGLDGADDIDAARRVRELESVGIIDRELADVFHVLRRSGEASSTDEAVQRLQHARQLAIWFHRTFGDETFEPDPFVLPSATAPGSGFAPQTDAPEITTRALQAAELDADTRRLPRRGATTPAKTKPAIASTSSCVPSDGRSIPRGYVTVRGRVRSKDGIWPSPSGRRPPAPPTMCSFAV